LKTIGRKNMKTVEEEKGENMKEGRKRGEREECM
jgi:hypothetical protein